MGHPYIDWGVLAEWIRAWSDTGGSWRHMDDLDLPKLTRQEKQLFLQIIKTAKADDIVAWAIEDSLRKNVRWSRGDWRILFGVKEWLPEG